MNCTQVFQRVGLEYSDKKYACYNEELNGRELCPFAAIDCCISDELPNQSTLEQDSIAILIDYVTRYLNERKQKIGQKEHTNG